MNIPKGLYSIPNLLCMFRVVYLPAMVLLFYLDHLWRPQEISWPAWTNVVLFTLAGLSDFLDGKIARWLKQETLLGKFLDSSTDKMLVGAALMCLVAYQVLDGSKGEVHTLKELLPASFGPENLAEVGQGPLLDKKKNKKKK